MAKDQDSQKLTSDEIVKILEGIDHLEIGLESMKERFGETLGSQVVAFTAFVKDGSEAVPSGTQSRISNIIVGNTSLETLARHIKSGDIYSVTGDRTGGDFHN